MFDVDGWQELACNMHGLVHPNKLAENNDPILDLGHFRIIDSQPALEQIIDQWLKHLQKTAAKIQSEYMAVINEREREKNTEKRWQLEMSGWQKMRQRRLLDQQENPEDVLKEFDDELLALSVLSYDDYIRFLGREEAELKRDTSSLEIAYNPRSAPRDFARWKFARAQNFNAFKPTFEGYKKYLKYTFHDLFNVLSRDIPALVLEEPRQEHTYITSTTKTGKSELLKAMILNYIQQPDYAGVVMLDPGGDMVPQMSRWPELIPSGQLVYIDPLLSKYNKPVINPFDAEELNSGDRDLLTEQIVAAIGTAVEGKLGGIISTNMETLLTPSIRLLIDIPNTTIRDLSNLMKDDPDLIAAGQEHENAEIANFFKTEYLQIGSLRQTKQSIVVKLRNILSKPVLEQTLCGRTTIDLERLMAERKIILINLAKGRMGAASSSMFGTLLVALISAIAMKRERLKQSVRPMTHLMIDECQNFVTGELKTIIRENRKFGLAVTLAQQEVGGDMSPDLMKVVTSTTNVKIAGRSQSSETRVTADMLGVTPPEIAALGRGQFFYKSGNAPAFLLHVRSDRVDYRNGMSTELWKKIIQQQQDFYYRRSIEAEPKTTGNSNKIPEKKNPVKRGYDSFE